MVNKEIEVLGTTKEQDYTKPIKTIETKEKENKDDSKKVSHGKRRLKKGLIQKIFCLVSALFILGCFLFYGSRLVKYYKIYNPKDNTSETKKLSDSILKESNIVTEGNGLYKVAGSYIYKGDEVNNYLKYSNLLWRIVKISNDGTIEIVLDDNINVISFDKSNVSYLESDIHKYLNQVFIKNLNTDLLVKTSICLDEVSDINNVTCNSKDVENFVKLVDISTFLNSKVDDITYISDEATNNIWTSSTSHDKVWSINGTSLSTSAPDEAYFVKPVVTLKNTNKLLSGKGTADNPYQVDKKKGVSIGDYVKLGNDDYIIYEIDGEIAKLQAKDAYAVGLNAYSDKTPLYDLKDTSGIAYYLNNEYYNSLSYKDKLVEATWYTGRYNGEYNTIYDDSMKSYVGMLNVLDLKFNNVYGYYLLTPVSNTKVYLFNEELEASQTNVARNIRPTIAVNKSILKKGKGTVDNPYKVGE